MDLFHKDRQQHVENLIHPALQAGEVVILDRYYFSTMAYQGIRGFNPEEIRKTNERFAPRPDLLLLLDLSIDTAMSRIGVRDGSGNEFEKRGALQLCRDIFHSVTDDFVHTIDAAQSVEHTHEDIMTVVEPILVSRRAQNTP